MSAWPAPSIVEADFSVRRHSIDDFVTPRQPERPDRLIRLRGFFEQASQLSPMATEEPPVEIRLKAVVQQRPQLACRKIVDPALAVAEIRIAAAGRQVTVHAHTSILYQIN
jgi:hypothetical protein